MSAKMSTKKKKSFTAKPGSYTFRKKVTPWCILFLPMAFTVWLKYYPIFSASVSYTHLTLPTTSRV